MNSPIAIRVRASGPRPLATLCLWAAVLWAGGPALPGQALPREANPRVASSVEQRVLAAGTKWRTHYYSIDSGVDGPVVMVLGGVHGDEPAGARAARQIAGWSLERGRMVVVPRANELALRAGKRRTPGLPKNRSDLNRQFPVTDGTPPRGVLAGALWNLVKRTKPDHLLDLHEGYDFTQINPKSVGSSVISDGSQSTNVAARRMLAALNTEIDSTKKKFVIKGPAVSGSLARAAHERLRVQSMILETTTKNQTMTLRVRQHRILVHTFLVGLRMVAHGPHRLVGTAADDSHIKVGMYVSLGVGGAGPRRLEEQLTPSNGFVVRRVCAADLRSSVLAQFDVVIFPGGSASKQANNLEVAGRDAVRSFVGGGGGYVGICAGAYLAAHNYSWSLKILDANVIDRKHWARGKGDVPIELTPAGRKALDSLRVKKVRYANGPIYAPAGNPKLEDFDVLAHYRGEVRKKGVPGGVMPGTPAIVSAAYGQGRVVCSSPHPEQTETMENLVRRLVRLAARRPGR